MTSRPRSIGKRGIRPPSIFARPFARPTDRDNIQILTPEEQASIAEISQVVEMPRNTVIYAEGGRSDFVYNIVSGVAETYNMLPDGERRITSFLFPFDLLGLSEGGQYVGTAQTLTPVVAYRIPFEALETLIRRDPRLDAALLCKLSHELRQSERHMITVSRRDARARVAAFILWLRQNENSPGATGPVVRLPMLRHDIADYLGMSKESVSRTFLRFETDRLLRRDGPRALRLLDIPGLERMAGTA